MTLGLYSFECIYISCSISKCLVNIFSSVDLINIRWLSTLQMFSYILYFTKQLYIIAISYDRWYTCKILHSLMKHIWIQLNSDLMYQIAKYQCPKHRSWFYFFLSIFASHASKITHLYVACCLMMSFFFIFTRSVSVFLLLSSLFDHLLSFWGYMFVP